MSEIKKVLIIGASGNMGPAILKAVHEHPAFDVSVLSRKGSKSRFPSDIPVISVDGAFADENDLVEAFTGQDAVIDLAPLTLIDQHLRCVDAAVKAGVKRFIPSEFGSNTADPRIQEAMSPIFDGQIAVIDYLKKHEVAGLTWTGIITGPFFDWKPGGTGFLSNEFRLPFDIPSRHATIYGSGNNRTNFTVLSSVGQAVVGVLLHPEETKNRYVHINSFFASQNEVLAALETATKSKWTVTYADIKETFDKGKSLLLKGDDESSAADFGLAINGVSWSGGGNGWTMVNTTACGMRRLVCP